MRRERGDESVLSSDAGKRFRTLPKIFSPVVTVN